MLHRTFMCDACATGMDRGSSSSHPHPPTLAFPGHSVVPVEESGGSYSLVSASSSSSSSNGHYMQIYIPEVRGYSAGVPCDLFVPPSMAGSCTILQNHQLVPFSANAYGSPADEYHNIHAVGNGRGQFKRKNPNSLVHGMVNTMSYQSHVTPVEPPTYVGSQPCEGSMSRFQYCAQDVGDRGGAHSIYGERNVRRRTSGSTYPGLNVEILSDGSMHQFRFAGHPLDHLGGDFGDINRNAAIQGSSQTLGPYRRIAAPDNISLSHGVYLPPTMLSNSNWTAGTNERDHFNRRSIEHDRTCNSNSVLPRENPHVAPVPCTRGGHSGFSQGPIPSQRSVSSLRFHHHAGSNMQTVLDSLQSRSEPYGSSSRFPRPLSSVGGQSSNRTHRMGVMMVDRSSYYGSGILIDQHREMRMDIDNMSYEELLALGQHIGDVSTGLSEEDILKRLKKKTYVTSHKGKEKMEEDERCVICQEEYNNKDELGTLDCGHNYHFNCIRQWLLLKNICPICKATALGDGLHL